MIIKMSAVVVVGSRRKNRNLLTGQCFMAGV